MKKLLLIIGFFAFAIRAFAFIPANSYRNNITPEQIELTGNKITLKEKFL